MTRESHVVTRGDEQPDSRIADAMLDSLQRYPIVVAYLGSEGNGGWNANVMFEVGYRLATRKPLVLIAHDGESVPFDLKDFRHVAVPPAASVPYRRHLSAEQYDETAAALRASIQQQTRPDALASPFPIADLFIDTTTRRSAEERGEHSIFVRASDKANQLFHVIRLYPGDPTLVGKQLTDVDRRLEPLIEPEQRREFALEQKVLLGRLLLGEIDVEAAIPLLFKDEACVDEPFRGRAFLPLMTDYEFKENGLAIRMLYLEIPSQVHPHGGVVRVDASDCRSLLREVKARSATAPNGLHRPAETAAS